MALPTYPKCEKHTFKAQEVAGTGAGKCCWVVYRVNCGYIVGAAGGTW
jgi:hypothetical protein